MRIPLYLLIVGFVAMLSGCGTTGKSALLGHHTDFTMPPMAAGPEYLRSEA